MDKGINLTVEEKFALERQQRQFDEMTDEAKLRQACKLLTALYFKQRAATRWILDQVT